MISLSILLQIIIAVGLINVWIIRRNQATSYRGGSSTTLSKEFEEYGLSRTTMILVGTLKISIALLLLIGIWVDVLVFPATILLTFLMISAIGMHLRIHDTFKKLTPAGLMLLMSLLLLYLHW